MPEPEIEVPEIQEPEQHEPILDELPEPDLWNDWEQGIDAIQHDHVQQALQQPGAAILDVTTGHVALVDGSRFLTPQPDGSSFFRVIELQETSPEELSTLLQERSTYKRELFADAIQALTENPDLADVDDCDAGATEACLSTASATVNTALPQRGRTVMFGLDRYRDSRIPQLANPISDAQAIGQAFAQQMNYDVELSSNATKVDILQQFNQLIEQSQPQDSVVIYFAGHGQMVDATGMGYWLPSDASASNPRSWISNRDISRALSRIRSKQIIVIADACYSGTLAHELQMSQLNSEADVQEFLKHRAVTVMTSGGEEPVADGGRDGHSVFAWSLLQQLNQVEHWQTTAEIYNQVRQVVESELPQQPMYGAILSAGHETGADFLIRAPARQ